MELGAGLNDPCVFLLTQDILWFCDIKAGGKTTVKYVPVEIFIQVKTLLTKGHIFNIVEVSEILAMSQVIDEHLDSQLCFCFAPASKITNESYCFESI